MTTNTDLIHNTDIANIKRLAAMIEALNNELCFIPPDTRAKVVGAATPVLIERAFTNYDD